MQHDRDDKSKYSLILTMLTRTYGLTMTAILLLNCLLLKVQALLSQQLDELLPVVQRVHPFSMSFHDLADKLGGTGRAQRVWEVYRSGNDPLQSNFDLGVGKQVQEKLMELMAVTGTRSSSVTSLLDHKISLDGTTKLLLELSRDRSQIESVIIPQSSSKPNKSTLCISSQVGCAQACTFCQTGRMGKLRSLETDEIVEQLWVATKWIRQKQQLDKDYPPPIENVVFMGMGEAGDNVNNVVKACQILTDDQQFRLAPRRVTLSTVGPTPQTFHELAEAPAVLAWSVHASRQHIRDVLVPTTKYKMTDLRDEGLIAALAKRSRRMRSVMIEIALIDGVNDSVEDAEHLVEFCRPILDVPGAKLIVNLIPWNDIQAPFGPASRYQRPSPENVSSYQRTLATNGVNCFIRTTRGDDEAAACGQLATMKHAKE